ncbi:MAG: helix-turn-helix transcriptional regulator [Lentisphaeria bacterium]
MLALVKTPLTEAEVSISGGAAAEILTALRTNFTVTLLSRSVEHPDDDDTLLPPEAISWWNQNPGGRVIAGHRLRLGLTQAKLAGRVGIPQSHLSRLESGRCKLTPDMAARLGQALGVDLSNLPASGQQLPRAARRRQPRRSAVVSA